MKTFGLLALAATVLAAFFGTTSAPAAKFTAGKAGVKYTETTLVSYVFTVTGGESECNEVTATGTTEGTEYTNQKTVPSFSACTSFGFGSTVTNSGCTYNASAGGSLTIEGASCTMTMQVNNPFAKCKSIMKAQGPLGTLSYSNGSGDIVGKANVTGVIDEVTESSGLCPLTVGKHTNGSYVGESTGQAEGTTISWDA